MDYRYQSLEWKPDPQFRAEPGTLGRQSLDDLINDKCRLGWELQGIYSESTDGSKYRVLFRIPCPEQKLLDTFASENGLVDPRNEQQQAALALLDELRALNGVCGFRIQNEQGGNGLLVSLGPARVVGVAIPDGSCSIYVGRRAGDGKEVPLRFNLIDRVLEPKDDGALTAGHTALSVLVGEILKRPSSK